MGSAGTWYIGAKYADYWAALAPMSDDEPPLPDEARDRVVGAARDGTVPVEAGPEQVLHVRFAIAPADRLVTALGPGGGGTGSYTHPTPPTKLLL